MTRIAKNIKKPGIPLGGVGAERTVGRKHSLVFDDRLISKQYIKGRIDDHIDDTAYGSGWDGVTDKAPSVNAVYDKINSLGVVSDIWGQEDASQSSTDVRAKRTGNYGFGNGTSLNFDDITEKVYVDGNIKATGDLLVGDDVSLLSDASILNFGTDSDVNLTHVADTGLLLNSTRQLQFGDSGTYIHQSADGVLDLVSDTEIEINATTIDINGAADVSGNLGVGGNVTVTGNLTVAGSATALTTETITMDDNIIILNSNASGSASVDAGIEVERGSDANTRLVWDESTDKWSVQPTIAASTYHPIVTTGDSGTVTNTMLAGSIANTKLSNDSVTVGSTEIDLGASATTIAGLQSVTVAGTSGSSGTTALNVTGGNSAASNAAVSITGHLEATTKSFNIPHPLYDGKRLVYGSLEGPEHGMYARGSFDVIDDRRKVGIDLPSYWATMVNHDYTIGITAYGNYNVWIEDRNESGFWVKTNSEDDWSFDWSVIGCRKDAKLEVEPDA
jgi:hypothetical protein